MIGFERLVAEPQTLEHAGAKILDEHIGLRDQPLHHGKAFRLLQIDRNAFLVAVESEEIMPVAFDSRLGDIETERIAPCPAARS